MKGTRVEKVAQRPDCIWSFAPLRSRDLAVSISIACNGPSLIRIADKIGEVITGIARAINTRTICNVERERCLQHCNTVYLPIFCKSAYKSSRSLLKSEP